MTRRSAIATLALVFALVAPALWAAASPEGFWLNQEGTSIVRIAQTGGKLSGRIVWLKEPNYPAGDSQGRAGKPKVDEHNPTPAEREHKLLGMYILWGFSAPDGSGVCEGGRIYDPRNGKTYSATMSIDGNDRLNLRGYIMVSMIGRTNVWTRVDPGKYGLTP